MAAFLVSFYFQAFCVWCQFAYGVNNTISLVRTESGLSEKSNKVMTSYLLSQKCFHIFRLFWKILAGLIYDVN